MSFFDFSVTSISFDLILWNFWLSLGLDELVPNELLESIERSTPAQGETLTLLLVWAPASAAFEEL